MNTTQKEEELKLYAWGWWILPRIDRLMGARAPGWTREYIAGYRDRPSVPIDITDDEAMEIDAAVCQLGQNYQQFMLAYYGYRQSLRGIERLLSIPRRQGAAIKNDIVEQIWRALRDL